MKKTDILKTSTFNLLSLNNSSPGQFWGAPITQISLNFQTSCCNLKNHRSGSKTVCDFSIILILKGIMTELSQLVHVFCWTKIETLIKMERNRKWEISHTVLGVTNVLLQLYKEPRIKSKELAKAKGEYFLHCLFCPTEFLLTFLFNLNV